jgi:hypothetical protein
MLVTTPPRNANLPMLPMTLALVGLLIGAALYALLVRRRAAGRMHGRDLANALTTSNEIALARLRDGPRQRAAAVSALEDRGGPEVVVERRSGHDRRAGTHRGRGRGRRSGGERRRGPVSR